MRSKGNAPSSRVITSAIIVTIVVVGTISFSVYKKNNPDNSDTTVTLSEDNGLLVSIENTSTNVDTDGDSLYDWEENLRGTDPNNPDTDGDGTQDGIEIGLNRNPLVAGPDDALTNAKTLGIYDEPLFDIDENAYTAEVGVDIITKILNSVGNSGETLDKETLVANIVAESEKQIVIESIYKAENMIIDSSNTEESIKTYINDILVVLSSVVLEENPTEAQTEEELNLKIERYHLKSAERLSAIKVPELFVNIHVAYINSLYRTAKYYEYISKETQDPLLAYAAAPKLNDELENTDRLFRQIISYIEKSGIIFEEDEPAYALFN